MAWEHCFPCQGCVSRFRLPAGLPNRLCLLGVVEKKTGISCDNHQIGPYFL